MSVVYLKDMVGSTLPKCLHDVCQVRPHDPIEYISKWLYRSVDAEIYFYDKAIFVKEVRSMVLELEKENITRKRAIIAHNEKMKRLKAAIFADKEKRARLLQKMGLTTPPPSPQIFQSSDTAVHQDKKSVSDTLVPEEFQLDDADRQKPSLGSLHSDSMFLSDAAQAVERSKQRADKRLQAIKEVRKHMASLGLSKAHDQQEHEEAQRAEFEEKMRVFEDMKRKRIEAEVARKQKAQKKSSGDEDSTSDHDGEVDTKSKKIGRSKKGSLPASRRGTFPRGRPVVSAQSSDASTSEGSSESYKDSRRSLSSSLISPRQKSSTRGEFSESEESSEESEQDQKRQYSEKERDRKRPRQRDRRARSRSTSRSGKGKRDVQDERSHRSTGSGRSHKPDRSREPKRSHKSEATPKSKKSSSKYDAESLDEDEKVESLSSGSQDSRLSPYSDVEETQRHKKKSRAESDTAGRRKSEREERKESKGQVRRLSKERKESHRKERQRRSGTEKEERGALLESDTEERLHRKESHREERQRRSGTEKEERGALLESDTEERLHRKESHREERQRRSGTEREERGALLESDTEERLYHKASEVRDKSAKEGKKRGKHRPKEMEKEEKEKHPRKEVEKDGKQLFGDIGKESEKGVKPQRKRSDRDETTEMEKEEKEKHPRKEVEKDGKQLFEDIEKKSEKGVKPQRKRSDRDETKGMGKEEKEKHPRKEVEKDGKQLFEDIGKKSEKGVKPRRSDRDETKEVEKDGKQLFGAIRRESEKGGKLRKKRSVHDETKVARGRKDEKKRGGAVLDESLEQDKVKESEEETRYEEVEGEEDLSSLEEDDIKLDSEDFAEPQFFDDGKSSDLSSKKESLAERRRAGRREERKEERRKKEKYREIRPVICEWDLEEPRVLVCKHPILGIIKSRHPQVLQVLDSPKYWDSHYFHCEVFYDHEIYTVCDPHGDDAEYEDQMIDWDAEENVNFKGLL